MSLVLPRDTHFRHPQESVVFHFWHPEKSISHEHSHEYCELFLVGSGSGIHVINEKPYLLSSGTLCYLNRQDYHLFEEMKDLQQVNLLYLGRDSFNFIKHIDYLLPQEGESNVWQLDIGIMQHVFDRLASHKAEEFSDPILAESHKEMIFLEVLHTLNLWRYKTQEFHSSADRISQVLIHLNGQWQQPLDLDALCQTFSLSRRTLQRGFSDYTGVSPQQYLARLRLLQSRYQLRFTSDSVNEIASRCGFGDVSYFSRAFRRQFGVSPNQCR